MEKVFQNILATLAKVNHSAGAIRQDISDTDVLSHTSDLDSRAIRKPRIRNADVWKFKITTHAVSMGAIRNIRSQSWASQLKI